MAQTRTDIGIGKGLYDVSKPIQDTKPKNKKQECEARGGVWDEVNQVCLLNNNKNMTPLTQPQPKATLTKPEITKDAQGRNAAITLPSGETYVGMKPEDLQKQIDLFNGRTTVPEGTNLAGTAQATANRQQRLQQLMQLGQQGLLSPQELQAIQEAPIDWGQALTAGTVGSGSSIIEAAAAGIGAGATAGAIGGSIIPGVGTIAGSVGLGIAGGITGIIASIYSGVKGNIKSQQSGEIGTTKDVLSQARTNMRALSMVVSQDPNKADEAIQLYYEQKSHVLQAQRKLQLETQGNLNKFMNDGTQDLADFELFLQPGGYADIQLMRLQTAISKGAVATPEELVKLYQEEYSNAE